MLPSSRVKLNRKALKDVIGLKLVPRRIRTSKSLNAAEPFGIFDKPVDTQVTSEPLSVDENAVSVTTEPVQNSSVVQGDLENMTGTPVITPEKAPAEENPSSPTWKRRGTQQLKRRINFQSCKLDDVDVKRVKEEGPYIRDEYDQSRPHTREIDREGIEHPNPTGLADRRTIRASGCGLCGDCKHVPSEWKNLVKKWQKCTSPSLETPITKSHKKIVILIDKYPKVTLCDIAQKCDGCRQGCGYVIPDVLKTKIVHCFEQDMKAGFRFKPKCSGHNKGESALAKNCELCPSVQSEKSLCQSQSLNKHQKHKTEYTDAETLTNFTSCHFLKEWTSEASANCSASFLLGTYTNKGECRTGMLDRDIEEDIRPGSDLITAVSGMSVDSHLLVGGTNTFGSFENEENSVQMKPWVLRNDPRQTIAAQISSEMPGLRDDVGHHSGNADEVDSCQRARVYFKQTYFSCARTDTPWPFPRAGTQASPVEPVDSSPRNNDSPISQNQPGSPCSQTIIELPNSKTDSSPGTAHWLSCGKEEKREDDARWEREKEGESTAAKENGKVDGNIFPCSLDMEHLSSTLEAKESLTSPPSELPNPSTHKEPGKPGTDTVLTPSSSVNECEPDKPMSPALPSPAGLNDSGMAPTLSCMSPSLIPDDLSSLSATQSSVLPFLPQKKVKCVNSACTSTASFSSLKSMVENPSLFCEEVTTTSSSTSYSDFPCHSDSSRSCESFLQLQEEQVGEEELVTSSNPAKVQPCDKTFPLNNDLTAVTTQDSSLPNSPTNMSQNICINVTLTRPLLSPVSSPHRHSLTSFLPQIQHFSSDEEWTEENKEESEPRMLDGDQTDINDTLACFMRNGNAQNNNVVGQRQDEEHGNEELERGQADVKTFTDSPLMATQFSSSSDRTVVSDDNIEDSWNESDHQEDVQQGTTKSELVHTNPKMSAGVLEESCSSGGDGGTFLNDGESWPCIEKGSSSSERALSEGEKTKAQAADDTQSSSLDEVTAYEQDILLVDVTLDDPELFENLPKEGLLKLGSTRFGQAPKPKPRPIGEVKTLELKTGGSSLEHEQRFTPLKIDFNSLSHDSEEETDNRPWRPQCSSTSSQIHTNASSTVTKTKTTVYSDANNNPVNAELERSQPMQTVNTPPNHTSALLTLRNGPLNIIPPNKNDIRRPKSNAYCRKYFSESLSCSFKKCWFQHVPMEGDEKFCIETVMRFTKNPVCLQKAGAVYTSYYQNNLPGAYFSLPVFTSLLWALLKVGLVSDVFSVLKVSLTHKIVPDPEFLLALFNFVREKGLIAFVPELMQLTSKIASAGLVLSLDCLERVQNTPEFQKAAHPNSVLGIHKLTSQSMPFPESLTLAHAIVEIELCIKQEDWRRMGKVFKTICKPTQHPNELERISGRIATALLSESKDELSLPFAAFTEMVGVSECGDSLIHSFLGRIGVSLMVRYYKTHQWAKGRKVVEVLSRLKVNYPMLKGLFGNEDGASRCCLVTVATELFLMNGSMEGALNTLRDNEWFLSSHSWPCEPGDLESRSRVLIRLAEKTSHRDTLEILCNLPGLKEPNDLNDSCRYSPLFNSHLQKCMDRQLLPVASDLVNFMLSKKLAVNSTLLQMLLHKLGKQNLWLRAREVFKRSLSAGLYPGVYTPPGTLALAVSCRLGEVELALTFEMFISVNAMAILNLPEATTSCLSITLKRTQNCESDYLSAGSRLLSAAHITQPTLTVRYIEVNSSQEQVFTVDVSSARRWLRHNHLWARKLWAH